jgi:hypothetical protein
MLLKNDFKPGFNLRRGQKCQRDEVFYFLLKLCFFVEVGTVRDKKINE